MTPAQSISSWTEKSPLIRNAVFVIFGSLLLAACSWIAVPVKPVPITMQTYALLLIGAFCGSRLAFVTVCAYLMEGALGLPVFANGAGGLQHLIGPTGGYLVGFPFAAAFVGWCIERGLTSNVYATFGAMIIAHLMVILLGVAWLTTFFELSVAIATGFMPFILGALLKSALAMATVEAWQRYKDSLSKR